MGLLLCILSAPQFAECRDEGMMVGQEGGRGKQKHSGSKASEVSKNFWGLGVPL